MPGFVVPIAFIETSRFFGIYPLKQFAPVIHGNHQLRAASQWAKTLRRTNIPFPFVAAASLNESRVEITDLVKDWWKISGKSDIG